ncbi:hypothetical protein J7T55_012417 [Diaporthe amygdali]|uniref:uncharacterized protein n=1 Tax=Phomopsis amygdali TaxID=1214568 RepID=UPI0022FDE1FB|nr:uncharacterized protein J7T55_012417 [Diaporthe amygdali]KAJ0123945.1 hypothetical protein J7T55_012417 [Diaporthe amygdali]
MATPDLQNSYGPEMAQAGHDLPQAVVGDGPEAVYPGQQHPVASAYSEQYAKDNNQYSNSPPGAPIQPQQKRRVLGLPVVAFWGIIIGLVLALAGRKFSGGGDDQQCERGCCDNICRNSNGFEYNGE